LRVCLVDVPPREGVRIGETVPPHLRSLIEHLGLWQSFLADRHCASYRTVSAWGSPHLGSNEFLFDARQMGWRLDRARFDDMMLVAARDRVSAHVAGKATDIAAVDGAWRIAADGVPLTAQFAVDATGRVAALASSQGLRPVVHDRLLGCFVLFEGAADDGEGLMIETFPDGWWYSAAVPGGYRVIACMSDADFVRRHGVGRLDRWLRVLGETVHVRATAAGARPVGEPRLRPAGSQCSRASVLPLLCVGDAASGFDPVSGQGIVKALRSGIFASYAIGDFLLRGDETGLKRYRAFVASEYSGYRKILRDYYALEQRWPDRPFWQRRHGAESRRNEPAPVAGQPPALGPAPPHPGEGWGEVA
jgi:flavin-dependent dehydrogenase